MNIIEGIEDGRLFRPLFKNLATWQAWLIYLRALFGLPIEGEAGRKLFSDCTGLTELPKEKIRESFVVCGRRSGKSFISAVIAVFLACFKDWTPFLSPGERGMIFIIAVDKLQAGIIKRYVSGLLHDNKILKAMVEKETRESIDLKNKISIMVKTCSYRTLRGYTIACAILEEIAFWRSEESANPDKEILAAVRPALSTIPGSLLLGISTPYSRSGVLYESFKKFYGQAEGPLIWRAPTEVMNPTVGKQLIEDALKEDPVAARAEWQAEFREDVEVFLPLELVEAAVVPGRYELPKIRGADYYAFCDPSGGRQDSFTLAVCHKERSGKIILDCIREVKPPFKPESVVQEFSDILKTFRVSQIEGDRFAGEWVVDSFRKQGITLKNSERSKSEIYLEVLPLIANGSVELLDSKRLIAQLTSLERKTRSGGRDSIDNFFGHDDLANAAAGAVVLAARKERTGPRIRSLTDDERRPPPGFWTRIC